MICWYHLLNRVTYHPESEILVLFFRNIQWKRCVDGIMTFPFVEDDFMFLESKIEVVCHEVESSCLFNRKSWIAWLYFRLWAWKHLNYSAT